MDLSFSFTRQKFTPNGYSECINHSIGNIPFKNVQDKKAQITIFLNKINDSEIEKLLMKYLNFFSNYNNVHEIANFSLNIVRNNKQIKKILEVKKDEKKEFSAFFFSISHDLMNSILISFLKQQVFLPKIFDESQSIEAKKILNLIFKNSLKKENKDDVINYFDDVLNEIIEANELSFNRKIEDIAQIIYQNIHQIFIVEIKDHSQEEQSVFFQNLQNTIYFQMNSHIKLKEILMGVILIQVCEILINLKGQISIFDIERVLNDYCEIIKYQKILKKELKSSLSLYIFFFNEIACKILDGEMNTSIFLDKVYYNNSLIYNIRINPIIIALCYVVFKMKNLKKNGIDPIYTDNNLPKLTLIMFEGYDNVDNYRMIRSLKHLQIISIYFDNNELRISEEIEENLKEIEKMKTKKHFISIPLRSFNIDPKNFDKEIKSKDILQIFEKIVFPLILNYRPSFIIMTHSFTFNLRTNPQNKISLNPKIFSIIFYKLALLCNYKIILVPVFNFEKDNPEFFDYELHQKMERKKGLNLPKTFFEKLRDYACYKNNFAFENAEALNANRFYVYEVLGAFVQILNGFAFFILNTDLILNF